MFYNVHLSSKNSSDYDGIESFVSAKLEENVIDWAPNAIAMCLDQSMGGGRDEEIEDPVSLELTQFKMRVAGCAKVMEDISKKLIKKAKD